MLAGKVWYNPIQGKVTAKCDTIWHSRQACNTKKWVETNVLKGWTQNDRLHICAGRDSLKIYFATIISSSGSFSSLQKNIEKSVLAPLTSSRFFFLKRTGEWSKENSASFQSYSLEGDNLRHTAWQMVWSEHMENRSRDDGQPNTLNGILSDQIQYMLIHSHKAQVCMFVSRVN